MVGRQRGEQRRPGRRLGHLHQQQLGPAGVLRRPRLVRHAVNTAGVAVGSMSIPGAGTRAAIYQDGQLLDLNTLVPNLNGFADLNYCRGIA